MRRLDLTFVRTGDQQHIFAETGAHQRDWLYKVPAAFGFLVPADHPSQRLPERNIWRLLVRAPGGTRLLQVRARRLNRRDYERMLDVVEHMVAVGLADILLPCRVVRRGRAILRVGSNVFQYDGPMLAQRPADEFFDRTAGNLDRYEWRHFVETQHRLWRHGVGFSSGRELLGPSSWTLLDGRLRLGDTGALTMELARVRAALDPTSLDVRVRRQMAKALPHDRTVEYFRSVRAEINQDRLEQLWRADVPIAGVHRRPSA